MTDFNEAYEEEQPFDEGQEGPNPADFEDYDLYVAALVDDRVKKASETFNAPTGPMKAHELKQAVAAGVQEAMTPPPQPEQLTPFADDPHRAKRAELVKLSMEYSKEAIMAGEAGKSDLAKTWRDRQRNVERDLAKLPPPPEVAWAKARAEEVDDISVKQLFDPALKDYPAWDHERMLADAPVVVARANKAAKTVLRLPAEESAFGNIEPCKPENMVTLELPPEKMREFKAQVYGRGEADPDTIFRRSWSALHRMGYASQAKRAFAEKESAEGKHPDKMTMSEFRKWREKQETERRGGPRKGFAWPRPANR